MNKNNEINNAHKPNEFFVCAYHFINANNNNNDNDNNKINSFDDQYNIPTLEYFDCNEGDIQSTTKPTEANLFKAGSLVYDKSAYYYNMYSPSPETSFTTMEDEYAPMEDEYTITKSSKTTITNSFSNSNLKQDHNNKYPINPKEDVDTNNSNEPVKVKIIVPMEDKKNAQKIKIMAMLKGQIKSDIVDVQKEFDEIGGFTIERTFAFDRNTDMGPIQIGDRFHACVIGKDLYPPEGSECEKRLIKHLDKTNSLAAR